MTSSWLGGRTVWKCSFPDDNDDKYVGGEDLPFFWWQMMNYFKQYNFVCLSFFWVARNDKKRFPFAWKKTTISFLTCLTRFFFFVFVRKKQVSLLLGFKQIYLFLLFFLCFPSDDNWWQVGRWYGIPNLVMTWWIGWVVVTKWSKWWWRHIEMVP